MTTPNRKEIYVHAIRFWALLSGLAILMFAGSTFSQPPPNPVPPAEVIATGALIIPMDNVHQGNSSGTTFNLRSYGLANYLLQNNIPIKWAIKPGKAKDDEDFKASFTRYSGNAGSASGTNVSFSGGPFIVAPEYAVIAKPVVTAFNNIISGTTDDVTVYQTTASATIDIRYTLTHKPRIAIGPDGGSFGTLVHQLLLNSAGIGSAYYAAVDDSTINVGSCFTIATQAHSTSTQWVSGYRAFVESGANLLLQCASINTFENNATYGRFQTTLGYSVFGTNDGSDVNGTPAYPNGAMPFGQFRGNLNGEQDGAITDYSLASGSVFQNGTLIAARHTGSNDDVYIATVSQVGNTGLGGGYVFEMGGHDYTRGTSSDLTNINGRRMYLNSLFVPPSRPVTCGLDTPTIFGYKWVALTTDVPPTGLSPNDTVTWTINYVNTGLAAAANFQIADVLQSDITLAGTAPSAVTVTATGTGTIAVRNDSYTGIGANTNLLAPGAVLGVNGRIAVTIRTTINSAYYGTILNWPLATGTNVSGSGVRSDTLDGTVVTTQGGVVAPSTSICQGEAGIGCTGPSETFQTPGIDPTCLRINAPTAAEASYSGAVYTAEGIGIRGVTISALNVSTMEVASAVTNSFGNFALEGLTVGDLHIVTLRHKSFHFSNNDFGLTLDGDVVGARLVADPETELTTPASRDSVERKVAPISNPIINSANASISGYVVDLNNIGLPNISISAVDTLNGGVFRTRTNSLGYYSLTDLPTGVVYNVSIANKKYAFSTNALTLFLRDELSDQNFYLTNEK